MVLGIAAGTVRQAGFAASPKQAIRARRTEKRSGKGAP
jgi:hypothetical protein